MLYEVITGDYADEIGTSILIEPINRYEINTLNKAVDCVDFIKNNQLKGVSRITSYNVCYTKLLRKY